MIRNIVFAGCSFTWGQSLHFFEYGEKSDNIHPLDGQYYQNKLLPHHYQYNVDNRFPTIVSDYFGRKPIVEANNGGSTESIYYTMRKINNLTDAVIIQTTQFHRSLNAGMKLSLTKQVSMLEEIVDMCKTKGIVLRFIHWDWPEEIEIPKKIKDKSIKILGMDTFYKITSEPINRDENFVNKKHKYYKYLACSSKLHNKHNFIDEHFSPEGHKMIAEEIIKDLEKVLEKPKYNLI
tara:strand:+ start:416 stop:1120 length:705 start_codon:yes stop_codon:yes gene_type:complete